MKIELEKVIHNYMSEFVLPNKPIIYDFLIMSLTNRNLIAAFNYDPFLIQEIERVQKYIKKNLK